MFRNTISNNNKSNKRDKICKSQDKTLFSSQMVSLLPVYLLELCYGMNSGFTAILTPQLYGDCAEFQVSLDQLSWVGEQLTDLLRSAKSLEGCWKLQTVQSVPGLSQMVGFLFPLKSGTNLFHAIRLWQDLCVAVPELMSVYLYCKISCDMTTASHYNSNDINFIILDSRLAI